MQIGVVFPQSEIESEVGAIRAYAQGAERLGFRHLLAYDHVVGADPDVHVPWRGAYDVHTPFQEPLVLFGYLAGVTTLELATGVVVLPQRQTVLVAKQAAGVDLLTGGRLRLGVGVGWNAVEYEALGKEFRNRGRRIEEQVALLRRLWAEPTVTFEGDYETVTGAGINPRPAARSIPIWLGGRSAPAFRRMGRLADGWIPEMQPGDDLDEARRLIDGAAVDAGRDPAAIGMDGRVTWTGDLGAFVDGVERWRKAGATHLSVNTMRAGLGGAEGHLEVLDLVATELGLGS